MRFGRQRSHGSCTSSLEFCAIRRSPRSGTAKLSRSRTSYQNRDRSLLPVVELSYYNLVRRVMGLHVNADHRELPSCRLPFRTHDPSRLTPRISCRSCLWRCGAQKSAIRHGKWWLFRDRVVLDEQNLVTNRPGTLHSATHQLQV